MKKVITTITALVILLIPFQASAGDCLNDPIYDRDWNAEVTTGAFLRSIPCMEGSEIYTTVPVGEIIHVIAETDGWYQIERSSGQEGWVGQWLITATNKTFLVDQPAQPEEPKEPLYDIVGHKNEDAIRELYSQGIISGHPDGSFKPDDHLNRAELVKLLIEASVADFNTIKSTYETSCFPDIAATEWYTPYVCYAKENNIVQGYADGKFRPAQEINKVEAVKVVHRTFKLDLPGLPSKFSFSDTSTSAWYASYLEVAHNNGILEEESGNFNPANLIQRGGVSHIIYETMLLNPIVPSSF